MGKIGDAIARIAARYAPPKVETTRDERQEERELAGGPLTTLGMGTAWDAYSDRIKFERTRIARYRDYDSFDEEDSLASGVLDIYTEHALHAKEMSETQIEVDTEDDKLKEVIEEKLDELEVKDLLWPLTRDIVKYGDAFEEHVFTGKRDLIELAPLNRVWIYRTTDPTKPLEERSPASTVLVQFDDVECTHFRLRRTRGQEYGTSILAPIRKVYKQLSMMEDGIVIRRLTRATQRYGFMVPTGKLGPDDQLQYIDKIRAKLKKRRLVTADGKLSLRDAPAFADEDLFVAVPDGQKADIKVLQADGGLGDIGDISHFLNRFFGGIKVPKAWMGFEEDVNAKATLTEQSIAFARAARRVQMAVRTGFHHVIDSSFAAQGIDPNKLEYRLLLPAMSTVDEMRDLEIQQLRGEIAKVYAVDIGAITKHVVLTRFLGLSEDEAEEIEKAQADEEQVRAEAQALADKAAQDQAIKQQKALAVANGNEPDDEEADGGLNGNAVKVSKSRRNGKGRKVSERTHEQESLWRQWHMRSLVESAREMSLWSLEKRAFDRAQDPADGKLVVYLGD